MNDIIRRGVFIVIIDMIWCDVSGDVLQQMSLPIHFCHYAFLFCLSLPLSVFLSVCQSVYFLSVCPSFCHFSLSFFCMPICLYLSLLHSYNLAWIFPISILFLSNLPSAPGGQIPITDQPSTHVWEAHPDWSISGRPLYSATRVAEVSCLHFSKSMKSNSPDCFRNRIDCFLNQFRKVEHTSL